MLLGQRGDRLQESQHQRDRQHEVDQYAQQPAAARQPFAARPRKENKRQKAVEQDDDEYQAERGLKNLVDAPAALAKHREAHQHGDGSGHELGQHRHGERGARPAHSQPGLDSLLEGVDVVLELARKESSDLGVDAVDVGDQRQQAKQQKQRSCDGIVHRVRAARVARAPPPAAFDLWLFRSRLPHSHFSQSNPEAAPATAAIAASLPRHRAIVVFMIVAHQMKHSVQAPES